MSDTQKHRLNSLSKLGGRMFWPMASPKILTLASPKILTLENKNKSNYILYSSRLFVSLASPKILTLDKTN